MIESGNSKGKSKFVSYVFGIMMTLFICGYLFVMYRSKSFNSVITITICLFSIISLLTFIYAIYIRPSYAELPKQKSNEEFLELLRSTIDIPSKKICAYCQIEKPEKARHCFICKRCVLEHDQHCFMLNNCVGKDNRQFVIAYLSSTSILMGSIVLSVILLFTGTTCGKGKDSKEEDSKHH